MASTNELWVNNYQNPFNQNSLFPAAEIGKTDPARAYNILKPAFDKIKSDAVAFVNQYTGFLRTSAQATIDRWKTSDWPLIQGFLDSWSSAVSIPQTTTAPAVTPVTQTSGCEAGICGPVAPTTPLAPVQTGSPGFGGVVNTTPSGGGTTVAPYSPLPGGLAPSPYTSGLPGEGDLTPKNLTPSGAVAGAGTEVPTSGGSTFSLSNFIKGPMGKVLLGLLALVAVLHFGVFAKKGG